MREDKIKWKRIGYYLGITEGAAKKMFERKMDIEELGKIPVIKKPKFDTPVVLRIKQMARENPTLTIRDFGAQLKEEYPDKAIPRPTTVHKILKQGGFNVRGYKHKIITPKTETKCAVVEKVRC